MESGRVTARIDNLLEVVDERVSTAYMEAQRFCVFAGRQSCASHLVRDQIGNKREDSESRDCASEFVSDAFGRPFLVEGKRPNQDNSLASIMLPSCLKQSVKLLRWGHLRGASFHLLVFALVSSV